MKLSIQLRHLLSLTLVMMFAGQCSVSTAAAATPTKRVRFYFNFGTAVDIELYGNESPLHVANFLAYVNADRYDNSYIHRSRAGSARFLQGGSFFLPPSPNLSNLDTLPIPTYAPVPNEFDPTNGLSNTAGTLAAARTSNPDSATSGWFINTTNNAAGFDPGPYTVFGKISRGMDLLNAVSFGQPTVIDEFGGTYPWLASEPYSTAPLVNGETPFVITQAIEMPVLEGDFNNDGAVNQADLMLWKSTYSQTGVLPADGNGDRVVNGDDLLIWQRNRGATHAAAANVAAVPEPSSVVLAAMGLAWLVRRWR